MGKNHLDECLELVSDTHRRRVIQRLREDSAGKTTVEDFVDHLHKSDSPAATGRCLDRRV
jgi:hypothetical protein